MSIDKLKTKFFTGAWLTDVKHYFTKINEIIDYLNGNGKSGDGSYKVYTALLNQVGSDNPTATILQNTLGDIIWTRNFQGKYSGTLADGFINNKTWLYVKAKPFDLVIESQVTNTSNINIQTLDGGSYNDDILYNVDIEIRVYN